MSNKKETRPHRLRNLDDPNYYRYAGTCKHCGFHCVWSMSKGDMSLLVFYNGIRQNHFPEWIAYCEGCNNEAVFELTAIQRQ